MEPKERERERAGKTEWNGARLDELEIARAVKRISCVRCSTGSDKFSLAQIEIARFLFLAHSPTHFPKFPSQLRNSLRAILYLCAPFTSATRYSRPSCANSDHLALVGRRYDGNDDYGDEFTTSSLRLPTKRPRRAKELSVLCGEGDTNRFGWRSERRERIAHSARRLAPMRASRQ